MVMTEQQVATTVKRVTAILEEAGVRPKTGRMSPGLGRMPDDASIAALIDHTLLKPEATARDIESLCYEAREYGFASVCINSTFVPLAAELLRDTDVKVCTVVGFPLGASLPQVKAYEAAQAIEVGAQEIDMVIAIGALKHRDLAAVHQDITEVAAVCHDHDALCKVILETALLDDEEKIIASQVARMAGADFVKTSTGFSTAGATARDIALMREVVGDGMGVKASGGVRTLAQAQTAIAAGANRLGASAGVSIVREERGQRANGNTPAATQDY